MIWWSEPSLHVGFEDRKCEETIRDDRELRSALAKVVVVSGIQSYLRAEWRKAGLS